MTLALCAGQRPQPTTGHEPRNVLPALSSKDVVKSGVSQASLLNVFAFSPRRCRVPQEDRIFSPAVLEFKRH